MANPFFTLTSCDCNDDRKISERKNRRPRITLSCKGNLRFIRSARRIIRHVFGNPETIYSIVLIDI